MRRAPSILDLFEIGIAPLGASAPAAPGFAPQLLPAVALLCRFAVNLVDY